MEEFLEYEAVMTLMTLTGVQRFGWDALGHILMVECSTAKSRVPIGLTREAAESLRDALVQALDRMPVEANAKQ